MKTVDVNLLRIDERERQARLGTRDSSPVEGEEIYTKGVKSVVCAAYVARRVKIEPSAEGVLLDGVLFKSEALMRVLSGSSYGYILVGTLGFDVDRRLIAAEGEPYRLFVEDAIADCLVEALLDYAEEELGCKEKFTNRFSPGYGDLDLSYSRVLVSMTGADKTLGIRFTESGLMSPKKSVNAIIGIKDGDIA